MNNEHQNNKRLAINTLVLYLRMAVTMVVSLFTARLTLQILGVEDFGIYNVVASIIVFGSIITGTMNSASQRFLAYDIAQNDTKMLSRSFSMLVNIFAVIAIATIVIFEIIGPYLIETKLTIPKSRLNAAQWVFQFTMVTFALNTMQIPFTASVIAYEKMGIYAYITFVEVLFKLIIVYALYLSSYDTLITYSFLLMTVGVITFIINVIYCKKKLPGCKYQRVWDTHQFKSMVSFAGWNLFGSASSVLNTQGQAIVLNMFYGPVVNAAKGIADRVSSVIYSFSSNFYVAVNPQIIKAYAVGDIAYTKKLVIYSSKFAFYLLLLLSVPLIGVMEWALILWLGKEQVTDEMTSFCVLMMIYSLITVLENPLTQAVRATGYIKKYQVTVGIQLLLYVPIIFIACKLGCSSIWTMIILCLVFFVVHFSRVALVSPIIDMPMMEYIRYVLAPITATTIVSFGLTYLLYKVLFVCHPIIEFFMSIVVVGLCIMGIGLNKSERAIVLNKVSSIIKKFICRRKYQ